jgi:hypothetical protein
MSSKDRQRLPSEKDGPSHATLRTLAILKQASQEKAQKKEAQRLIDRDFILRLIRERLSALTTGQA